MLRHGRTANTAAAALHVRCGPRLARAIGAM